MLFVGITKHSVSLFERKNYYGEYETEIHL
jgi:hypothetical protein